ncbi:MAG: tail fiber domain-containing protein [Pseudobacter sp.]|uniref:tail fiber domain-containing protein n=1 Tax=Pseudobacter sp. TaxID=2045420 RepID=UPI003F7F0666
MSKTSLLHAHTRMPFKTALFLFALCLFSPFISLAQIPDTLLAVRTSTLETRLSLHTNGSFYLGGIYNGGTAIIPVEGAGTRLLWHPDKSAFRAGTIDGTQWDDANIGEFSLAIGENCRASAAHAVALGRWCTAAQQSSFAMGDQNVASGAASVALGYHSHTNARQGSFVFGDRSTVDTIRAGVNHSANWRVSGGFRIFTSSNLSTGVTLQSGASVSNWGQSSAVISTSTGAMLTTGGVWQNASDVNRKHHFEPVSGEEVLEKLKALSIQEWSYRTESDAIRHIGPTAQDFYAAFQLGNDDKGIGTVDADGIALSAIQALEARTQKQATEIETLKAENELMHKKVDTLMSQVMQQQSGLPWLAMLIAGSIVIAGMIRFFRRSKAAQ